jgi:uncharacterized coiled-coil protein SlyX
MALKDLNVKIGVDNHLKAGFDKASADMKTWGDKMQGVGASLTQTLTVAMGGVAIAALKSADTMKKMQGSLQAVGMTSAQASDELRRLTDLALQPGMELQAAVKGSAQLQAFGLSADQARDSMGAFANAMAAAGNSGGLEQVNETLAEIAQEGEVTTEQIKALAQQVPQLTGAMMEEFGTTTQAGLEAAGVSGEEFISKMTAKLGELPEASQSAFGLMGKVTQAFMNEGTRVLGDFGDEIARVFDLKGMAEKAIDFIRRLGDWFKSLSDDTKKWIVYIGAAVAAIGPLLWAIGTLTTLFSGLGVVITIATSPITGIIAACVALAAIALYVYDNWKAFAARFRNLWNDILIYVENKVNKYISLMNIILKAMNFDTIDYVKLSATDVIDLPSFQTAGEFIGKQMDRIGSLVNFPAAGSKPSAKAGTPGNGAGGSGGGGGEDGKGKKGPKEEMDTVKELSAALAELETRHKLLGDAIDYPGEQIKLFEDTINNMLASGVSPTDEAILSLSNKLKNLRADFEPLAENVVTADDLFTALGGKIITVVAPNVDIATSKFVKLTTVLSTMNDAAEASGKAMEDYAAAGGKSFKEMGKAALKGAADVVRAKLMGAVAAAFEAGTTTAAALGPFAPLVGAAAAASAGLLFNAALSALQIPALAQGGMALSPTLAMIGDNPSGKEMVLPFERVSEFASMIGNNLNGGGGGVGFISSTRLQGSDIVISYDRTNRIDRRIYTNDIYAG